MTKKENEPDISQVPGVSERIDKYVTLTSETMVNMADDTTFQVNPTGYFTILINGEEVWFKIKLAKYADQTKTNSKGNLKTHFARITEISKRK